MRVGSFSRSSSTSRLSTDLQEPSPSPRRRLEEAQVRFPALEEKCLGSFYERHGEFTEKDRDLWHLLEQFALHGGSVLDLSAHGVALTRVPHEVMEALGEIGQWMEPPLRELLLPPKQSELYRWTHAFASAERLSLPGFCGRELNARSFPQLRILDLGMIKPQRMTVRVPLSCDLIAIHSDTRKAAMACRVSAKHKTYRLRPRILNFNCLMQFPGTKEQIVCRHMALEMTYLWRMSELRRLAVDATNPLDWLSTPDTVAQNVSFENDAIYRQLMDRPRKAHIVAHHAWADFVKQQFKQMKADGRSTAYALLKTPNHAIALRFDATHPGHEVVECFDPNFTTEIKRCAAPFTFVSLFHDWKRVRAPYFVDPDQPFGASQHVRITWIEDPLNPAGSVASTREERSVSTEFADLPRLWHPAGVCESVSNGFAAVLASLPKHVESADLSDRQCKALIAGVDGHGHPALHLAAKAGHAGVMAPLRDSLLAGYRRGLLTEKEIVQMLDARSPVGITALEAAFTGNHPDMVKAFGATVMSLWKEGVLPPPSVANLMRAKNRHGMTNVSRIRSNKVATAFDDAIGKLYKSGALTKDAYQDLREELKSAREDIALDKAKRKQANKAAKAALI